MRASRFVCAAGAALLVSAISLPLAAADGKESSRRITLAAVPQVVKQAATKAVAGITLSDSVEVEVENGQTIYEFTGTANGERYEIEVTEDGRVLEIEQGDDDDGEDDDDDKA